MAERVCGYKDSKDEFHLTELEASRASFIWDLKQLFNTAHDWYTVDKVGRYLLDKYNLLDRPTVPFWKTII